MKTVDKKALPAKTVKDLEKMVEEAYKTLNQFKLDHVQNKLKDTRSIFHARQDIAVLKSVLQQVKTKAKEETK